MKKLFHFGPPCDPPVVNGVEFKQSEEHDSLFVGEVPDDMAFAFDGVPQFAENPNDLLASDVAEAAPGGDHDDEGNDDGNNDGVDTLKADIEALEAKKAAEGKLAPAEAMKLGKLKKKLEKLTAAE